LVQNTKCGSGEVKLPQSGRLTKYYLLNNVIKVIGLEKELDSYPETIAPLLEKRTGEYINLIFPSINLKMEASGVIRAKTPFFVDYVYVIYQIVSLATAIDRPILFCWWNKEYQALPRSDPNDLIKKVKGLESEPIASPAKNSAHG